MKKKRNSSVFVKCWIWTDGHKLLSSEGICYYCAVMPHSECMRYFLNFEQFLCCFNELGQRAVIQSSTQDAYVRMNYQNMPPQKV